MNECRAIRLPTDVLLIVFESLLFPRTYHGWRRDLLNFALVCREWTCALRMLLLDFRHQDIQQSDPPEIVSFANALLARPSLALEIRHLSVSYFKQYHCWFSPFCPLPSNTSPSALAKLLLRQSARHSRFFKAFFSIVRVAENVKNLGVVQYPNSATSQSDLTDTLSESKALHTFRAGCDLRMAQSLSCITPCPSLKRLFILHVLPPDTPGVPLLLLSCRFTELELAHVPVMDDELACLVNASSKTLQRLVLTFITELTYAGLSAALTALCGSLTYLSIVMSDESTHAQGEEYVLDATIAHMEKLTDLVISPEVASVRMLERRAEAFLWRQRTNALAVLAEVSLGLMVPQSTEGFNLVCAAERDWPGWKMDRYTSTKES